MKCRALWVWLSVIISLAFASGCLAVDFSHSLEIKRIGKPIASFKVAIAKTPEQQAQGLMFIKNLEAGEGMYFAFNEPKIPKFWMKNTYVSLDILFIDESGKIIYIAQNCQPLSENPVTPSEKVTAVLEIKGGIAKELGVKKGDKIFVDF